ncbi:MAG: hypothetical protein Q8J84_01435 [Flavobacteriaceae bacterium]|nr:hypothetical protein [Flavobacteriaceae bacterium]
MFKIRVILDVKEDVLRDVLIEGHANLEQLHFAITKAFGFNGQEMASFYKADYQWNQGDEIPLFEMEDDKPSMQTCVLNKILTKKGDKLIYVYDFLEMWTFFVELIDIVKPLGHSEDPKVVATIGKVPKKAPKKEFKSETKKIEDDFGFINNGEDDLDDEIGDDYNDDFDTDDYYDDEY